MRRDHECYCPTIPLDQRFSCAGKSTSWCRITKSKILTARVSQVRPKHSYLLLINSPANQGFYYICIDLVPPSRRRTTQDMLRDTQDALYPCEAPTQTQSVPTCDPSGQARRASANANRGSLKSTNLGEEYTATMTGFYYHQSSEPCVLLLIENQRISC